MTNFLKNKPIKEMFLAGRKIGEILYPPRCLVCHGVLEAGEEIHKECQKQLYPIEEPVCMHCGKPLESESLEYCFDCKRKQKGKIADLPRQGKALYLYKGGLKQAMYRFKYSNCRECARFFAKQAVVRYGGWMERNGIEVIVPVPMFPGKKRKRGYNQAEVFARELSLLTGIPVEKSWIVRRVNTRPQKELNDIERKNNLKNAFQMCKFGVQYKKILVVDDIYTTGSTVEAVTKELKGAGAECVWSLSICIGEGC